MIEARDLTVTRGGAVVLEGVDAVLCPGAITAICGPNGAGKSTLLAALAGLAAPMQGTVTLDGHALSRLPAWQRARAIGYLPQTAEVAWDVDVRTLAELGRLPWRAAPGRRAGASPGEDASATKAALAALSLEPLARRPLSRLSGGERARALLARVLAGTPQFILADEPLANLDLAHQNALLGQFRAMANSGIGVALVLHDLAQAMNWADRVWLMERGRLVADAAPEAALSEAVIQRVWGVRTRWWGEPGRRALAPS